MKQLPSLQSYQRDGWLGNPYHYSASTGSTNDLASQAGQAGAAEGTLFVTEEQISGRGRFNRRWAAPAGCCLLMSLLFRPGEPFAYHAGRITMACGLAMQHAIRQVSGVETQLKWPNDVIAPSQKGYGKLAGMLSEVGLAGQQPSFLVVGIGLNVNITEAELSVLSPQAASLSALCGHPVARPALLDSFLGECETLIDAFRGGHDPFPRWRDALAWRHEPVLVHTPQGANVQGILHGVTGDGSLVLQLDDGSLCEFGAGDVSLRRA